MLPNPEADAFLGGPGEFNRWPQGAERTIRKRNSLGGAGKAEGASGAGRMVKPEAVPSERERNGHNGECKAELDCLSGDEETNFE